MSSLERKCLDSWKKHCSDYQLMVWNEDNFDVNYCQFTKKAYEIGKYAFVSDVARLYALEKYGGIYLDTDILLIKPFPDYLINSKLFFGKENSNFINAAVIGSETGNKLINELTSHYLKLPFLDPPLLIPSVLTSFLLKIDRASTDFPFILNSDVFYPLPYKLRKFHWNRFITKNTIGVHLWNASWDESNVKSRLTRIKYFISKYYVPTSFLNYAQEIR